MDWMLHHVARELQPPTGRHVSLSTRLQNNPELRSQRNADQM
jgi:hypothetical protein